MNANVDFFLNSINTHPSVCLVISAGRNSGKTSFLKSLIDRLKPETTVAGIIGESSDGKDAYFARNISTDERVLIMEEGRSPVSGDLILNRFTVCQSVFDIMKDKIFDAKKPDIVAIDEIGRLELMGQGWYSLLKLFHDTPLIVTVRDVFFDEVNRKLLGGRKPVIVERVPPMDINQ